MRHHLCRCKVKLKRSLKERRVLNNEQSHPELEEPETSACALTNKAWASSIFRLMRAHKNQCFNPYSPLLPVFMLAKHRYSPSEVCRQRHTSIAPFHLARYESAALSSISPAAPEAHAPSSPAKPLRWLLLLRPAVLRATFLRGAHCVSLGLTDESRPCVWLA